MKFLFNLFAVLVVFMVFGTSLAMAQDATETDEAPIVVVDDGGELVAPDVDIIPTIEERATVTLRDAVIAILLVVAGAVGSIAVLLSRTSAHVTGLALEKLYLSVPSYLQPSVASAIEGGVGRLKEMAESTTFTWDDEYIAELEKVIDPIVKKRMTQLIAKMSQEKAVAEEAVTVG